jgi:hypothetical protein
LGNVPKKYQLINLDVFPYVDMLISIYRSIPVTS